VTTSRKPLQAGSVGQKYEAHEQRIESARQELVSASDAHKRRVAASKFINLCRGRDPWLVAVLERERLERAKA
jgi:uncharacterized protein YaiL (DUF2058 family)